MIERLFPGADHLQNIHPLLVHFPIAFLPGAALLYFLAAILKRDSLKWAAFWMLMLGALGAALSAASGLYAGSGVMVAPSVRDALLEHHEHVMIAVCVAVDVLTLWALMARPMPERARWVFVAGLIAMCALLARGADYGGRLVYDYNAGGDACSQPIDFSK
ncbi:MAG: DUF2231 domain-containing protein [Candidatus Binataceae bacterium]